MAAQWIKLTGKRGDEVFINMETVSMMSPRKRMTRIWFAGACDDHVDVFESAAEIVTRLDEQLVAATEAVRPPTPVARIEPPPPRYEPPPAPPAPVRQEVIAPRRQEAPAPRTMNGVAAKLSRTADVKVSARAIAARDDRERPQMSEIVADQRDQRARRRASAIMDERRQQLARKLEAMRREKGLE